MDISVIIPTRNAEIYIDKLINSLLKQTIKPLEIIIIDTESKDNTKIICEKYDIVKFIGINEGEFDHGGTRNRAAKNACGEILVFMTQDALPKDQYFIEEIIKKLNEENVVASYGRQIARDDSTVLEQFARFFNYDDKEFIKSKSDIEKLGIKAFFMTNVCSAFVTKEFWDIGAFPEKTILNEDMIISSKIILASKKVHYAANACVIHSHNYTYMQQFKRNFDIAVSLVDYDKILKYAKTESEGVKYIKEAVKYLVKIKKIHLIPHLIIDSGFRFIGYKVGMNYKKIPLKYVKRMSMHSFYFNNEENEKVEAI